MTAHAAPDPRSAMQNLAIVPGDMVRLRDPAQFAEEVLHHAGGPRDPNAQLAVELAWESSESAGTFKVVSARPDLDGQYLTIQSRRFLGGDDFGAREEDVTRA